MPLSSGQAVLFCLALDGLNLSVTVIGTPTLVTQCITETDVIMKFCVISAFILFPFCSGTECYVNVGVLASDIIYLVHSVNYLHVRIINTVFD